MREENQDIANFLIVYIKEAHPDDEWQMEENLEEGVVFTQPKTLEERIEMAQTFVDKMEVGTTTLVDDISNPANACYAAWPERIYVIDTDGTIIYKGDPGPGGFKPAEVAEFLSERRASMTGASD